MAVPGSYSSSEGCSELYLLFHSVAGFRVYRFWFCSGPVPFRVLRLAVPVPLRALGITPKLPMFQQNNKHLSLPDITRNKTYL